MPDLFEVVDRRAKLVVGEKGDELPDPVPGIYLNYYSSFMMLDIVDNKLKMVASTMDRHVNIHFKSLLTWIMRFDELLPTSKFFSE